MKKKKQQNQGLKNWVKVHSKSVLTGKRLQVSYGYFSPLGE